MVMLTRSWKLGVAVFTALGVFGRFVSVVFAQVTEDAAMEPIAPPHDAETGESEPASAVVEKAPVEQAPPPAPSMPIGNRYVHAEPQSYGYTPQDDSWWMGMPPVLRNPPQA
jgi:hypothetical protein